jgi:hypothetical protein
MKQKDNQVKQLPAIYKLRPILTIIRKKIAKFQKWINIHYIIDTKSRTFITNFNLLFLKDFEYF